MKKKNVKTASTKAAHGGYGSEGQPIYLVLQGNAWRENAVYITTAIYQAQEHNAKLYITSQLGGPNEPPKCPPGFPNCIG